MATIETLDERTEQIVPMSKKLIVFDLDGTLAESKSALDDEMAGLLSGLLGVARVAVISGGDWPQFQKQLLANLPTDSDLTRLTLLPTCGTKFYRHVPSDGSWEKVYSEDLTDAEVAKTITSLSAAIEESGFKPEQTWGELVENRGTQITYSALGQQAPLEAKRTWDPDFSRRKRFKLLLDTMIPELSVHLGGATSVDITKPGIDKAYGISKLTEIVGVGVDEMLFMGDALFPGGNDAPVKDAGVDSIQVRDPDETKRAIEAVIACLA